MNLYLQLLKTIGPIPAGQKRNTTAAVMDLGGASTQIVFEPERTKLESGGHVYELAFGGKTHALYQHSHLGYGLMEARRAVHQMVGYSELWRRKIEWSQLPSLGPLGNPCLQPHTSRKVSLVPSAPPSSSASTLPQIVEFVGSAGGFAACRRVVELVIGKDAVCKLKPCAFAGVYQPSFAEAFADGPIYALVPCFTTSLILQKKRRHEKESQLIDVFFFTADALHLPVDYHIFTID
jgi:guanosine-diphosphatase